MYLEIPWTLTPDLVSKHLLSDVLAFFNAGFGCEIDTAAFLYKERQWHRGAFSGR